MQCEINFNFKKDILFIYLLHFVVIFVIEFKCGGSIICNSYEMWSDTIKSIVYRLNIIWSEFNNQITKNNLIYSVSRKINWINCQYAYFLKKAGVTLFDYKLSMAVHKTGRFATGDSKWIMV